MNKLVLKIIELYYSWYKKNRKFLLDMMPKNAVCAEIGVFAGNFSKQILKITDPKMLYLVDLWSFDTAIHPSNFDKTVNENKMNLLYQKVCEEFGNKSNVQIMKGYSHDMFSKIPDNHLDWIYIDGDHRYEGVKEDLSLGIKKVRNGGFITGDDYIDKYGWGVIRAVQECVKENNLKVVSIKKFQYILQKPTF